MSLLGKQIRVLDEIKNHAEEIAKVVFEGETQLGIEFSKSYGLHDCNGAGKQGCCWYIDRSADKFMLLSTTARFHKLNDSIIEQFMRNAVVNGYKVVKNGALIKATFNNVPFLLINASQNSVMMNKISNETEREYANHILEFNNILVGKGFNEKYELTDVPKETSVTPTVEMPVDIPELKTKVKKTKKASTTTKVYETEEEALRELGITK